MTKETEEKETEKKGIIGDFVGKLIATGTGAIFMTEGAIRNVLSELKLPRDVANYVIDQADRKKNELFNLITGELRKFLHALDISKELTKTLQNFSIKLKAEIDFSPKGSPHPKKTEVRVSKKKQD